MKRLVPLAVLAFLLPSARAQEEPRRALPVEEPAAPPAAGTVDDTAVSSSRQFRVSGGTSGLRATVALMAEETKTDFLKLIAVKDDWKVPLAITLHGMPGDPLPPRSMRLSLVAVDGAPELRLDCHLARGLDSGALCYRVTEALVYERSIRAGRSGHAEKNLEAPPWVTEGLREAAAWKNGFAERKLYEALFSHGGLYKLDDLFTLDDVGRDSLDGATRAAFVVSSGSLVSVLLEQPGGTAGFRAFLDEVASFEGEMPVLLRKHFPEMNISETSLAKWWALQLANKGGQALLTQVMSVRETEKAIAEALRLHFRDAEGATHTEGISAWERVIALPEPERRSAIHSAQDALNRASYRCFPSFRPLIAEYQQVLGKIVKGDSKNIAFQLAELEQNRTTMIARSDRARDYLDWFEITRARTTSGAFEDYLRLKERLKTRTNPRTDPVSKYLDRMDEIFSRGLPDKPVPRDDAPVPPPSSLGDLPPDALPGNVPVPRDPVPDQLPNIPLDLPR